MQAALLLLFVAAAATLLVRSKLLLLGLRLVLRSRSARKQYEASPIPGPPAAGSILGRCCYMRRSGSSTPRTRRRTVQWLQSCCLGTSHEKPLCMHPMHIDRLLLAFASRTGHAPDMLSARGPWIFSAWANKFGPLFKVQVRTQHASSQHGPVGSHL